MNYLATADFDTACLKSFVLVCEVGSFNKAAQTLGVSQSTISTHIKKLEDELGSLLFDRVGKHCVITPSGKLFFEYCNKVFALSEGIEGALQSLQQEKAKRIKILVDPLIQWFRGPELSCCLADAFGCQTLIIDQITESQVSLSALPEGYDGMISITMDRKSVADASYALPLGLWCSSPSSARLSVAERKPCFLGWSVDYDHQLRAESVLESELASIGGIAYRYKGDLAALLSRSPEPHYQVNEERYFLAPTAMPLQDSGFYLLDDSPTISAFVNIFGSNLVDALKRSPLLEERSLAC